MPDPNQPINPTQTPDPGAPVGMPVVEEITIPTMNQGQQNAPQTSDIPPPPPTSDVLGDGGTPPPPPDLPPVVPPVITPPPAKKFGGRRVIATILGLLVLGGGLTAGLILVRQQQLFRQKAAEECTDPNGCPPPAGCQSDADCSAGQLCSNGSCVGGGAPYCSSFNQQDCAYGCEPDTNGGRCKEKPGPAPTPYCTSQNYQDCVNGCEPDTNGGRCKTPPGPGPTPYCSSLMFQDCATGCEPTLDGGKCKSSLPSGCPSGYRQDEIYTEATTCEETWPNSGVVQIAVNNHYGGVCCFPPTSSATPVPGISTKGGGGTPIPGTPPPGEPSAQCLNIRAFDTSWNQLTSTQLAALKAGDKVRFTVSGATLSGTFDKARFTINGTLRPEVTTTRPGTSEFYDEYTIPEGTTSFSINAQLHHSTLGWF